MSQYINNYYGTKDFPQKLVCFLHGYNGCVADISAVIGQLAELTDNALIIAPEATECCEKNPAKKQWYSLRRFDPQDKRRNPQTALSELISIYNNYADDLNKTSIEINELIDEVQAKHNLSDTQTVIIGFSQGAMLACYAALTRRHPVAATVMFAGVVAGASQLEQQIKSRPPFYLFHGCDDISVNYKTLDFTKQWLTDRNIPVQTQSYPGLAHKINTEEIVAAAAVINNL